MVGNGGLGHATADGPPSSRRPAPRDINEAIEFYDQQFLPTGPRSLAGIAMRAFLLGVTLAASASSALYLLQKGHSIWRAPFFLATLSLFHFLEFWVTALSNTSDASVSSFLLTSNGPAYTIAHTVAFTECFLSHIIHPAPFLPAWVHRFLLALGLALVIIGQIVRTMAMNTAGRSFTHLVAHQKRATHTLITHGLYSTFRHPSYFGFFWWGIGTQLLCGNSISLVGFAIVLWYFFYKRIQGEEASLVKFFGHQYVIYKASTIVGIPFIS